VTPPQIPLSGYGGTSNIILEDQKKRADGYVATLGGVAAGRVSKACLCVRNTGSRAAFIKAVAYVDLPTRALMSPAVISLSPSQFVLKERTQEVGWREGRCVWVCVCMRERERERERSRYRETDRQVDTERQTDGQTDREVDTETERQTNRW